MSNNVNNVLRVNTAQETTDYRNAIARILLDLQAHFNITLHDIAETIDVSLGTISNAANKKTDLSPTFLKRLGERFGPEFLNPYAALTGGRMVPLEPREDDPLPALASLFNAMYKARADGTERDHRVKLAMLPDLKAAQAAITNMVLQAEEIRA